MSESEDFLRGYRDNFTIRIEVGSIYGGLPSEVFEVSHPSSSWSRDDAIDRLEDLTRDEDVVKASGPSDSSAAVPFTLDIKRSVTSWGADGATEQIVLRIAEWAVAGVAGNVAYAALLELLRQFGRATTEFSESSVLDRDEAYGLAQWGVLEKYKLPSPVDYIEDSDEPGGLREVRDDSLELVDETFVNRQWTFRWRRQPYEYDATVERLEGYATLTHYRRRRVD